MTKIGSDATIRIGARVFVTTRPRDGFTVEHGIQLWNAYLQILRSELKTQFPALQFADNGFAVAPITGFTGKFGAIWDDLKSLPYSKVILVAGGDREGSGNNLARGLKVTKLTFSKIQTFNVPRGEGNTMSASEFRDW